MELNETPKTSEVEKRRPAEESLPVSVSHGFHQCPAPSGDWWPVLDLLLLEDSKLFSQATYPTRERCPRCPRCPRSPRRQEVCNIWCNSVSLVRTISLLFTVSSHQPTMLTSMLANILCWPQLKQATTTLTDTVSHHHVQPTGCQVM